MQLENNFRTNIKRQVVADVMNTQVENTDEYLEKQELALRLLQFFQYEQDPDFEIMFSKFLRKKRWTIIEKHERELEEKGQDR